MVEKRDFETFVGNQKSLYESCYFVKDKIDIKPATAPLPSAVEFKDTLLYNKYDNSSVLFREISFYANMDSNYYRISIRKSLLESNKLIQFITGTLLILLCIGLSLMYLLNKKISQKIWSPFYDTLGKVKSYTLAEEKKIDLREGNISEFNELNDVLNKMVNKMRKDYKNLKEFTENASHEIQTPLSLINARVEELIQSKGLSEKQMYCIQEIYRSSLRISKLHHALLLLSKIENGQFFEKENINIGQLIEKKIDEFDEIFVHKKVRLNFLKQESLTIPMHPMLADILLTNLIGNAIKHNTEGGTISISVYAKEVRIINSGHALTVNPNLLFERFKKERIVSDSLGLGLSIVKQICDNYGLAIGYSFENNFHIISIKTQ
jgi:signal transduction histidine kinase